MVVASIAHYDWPEDWPNLLPVLIKLINDLSNMNAGMSLMNLNSLSIYAVNGALRCLALLSADLDDTVVPKIVPVLFPCLHTIISSPRFLGLLVSCGHSIDKLLSVYFLTYLKDFIYEDLRQISLHKGSFNNIVLHFHARGYEWHIYVKSKDPDDWSIRIEVHTWSLDANQYVADEDENTYNCHVSEIVSSCGTGEFKLLLMLRKGELVSPNKRKLPVLLLVGELLMESYDSIYSGGYSFGWLWLQFKNNYLKQSRNSSEYHFSMRIINDPSNIDATTILTAVQIGCFVGSSSRWSSYFVRLCLWRRFGFARLDSLLKYV
ncbi:hypothetical protein LguiA_028994 [Lonicera macranthoides]